MVSLRFFIWNGAWGNPLCGVVGVLLVMCQDCERLVRCVVALLDHAFDHDVREQAENLVEELAQQLKP